MSGDFGAGVTAAAGDDDQPLTRREFFDYLARLATKTETDDLRAAQVELQGDVATLVARVGL